MRIAPADIVADSIADVARPLPLSLHASFTEQVLARLRALPPDMIGEGLTHRICAEEQRHFFKQGQVGSKSGKYDRM
jgi:hypothetical protein